MDDLLSFDEACIRLATYGTLAPGRVNHHQLASLSGRWLPGVVRGRLVDEGWASELGYHALVLDPDGPPLEVALFESRDLISHWFRLDAFEGPGYRRVATRVDTGEGSLVSYIYVAGDA